MKLRADGKKALITGSSRGIGRAFALALAEAGADVIIHSTSDNERTRETASDCEALGVKAPIIAADLCDPTAPSRLFQEAEEALGQIDILVLNASIQIRRHWDSFSQQESEQMLQVNFHASHDLIIRALPGMRQRQWGRIITIGSVQQAVPNPQMVPYTASKLAQLSLVKSLAPLVAKDGITINNLAPGVIDTDRCKDALSNPDYAAKIRAMIPAGRVGQPEDCAGYLMLLCSDAGSYITGTDLFVDGCMALGNHPIKKDEV